MMRQERAIETRKRILQGTAVALAKGGYEGTTISDILTAAGVTKGALYFHFDSKESLARSIITAQSDWLGGLELKGPAAQRIVDVSYHFGGALQRDALVRASVRLTTEGHGFDAEQRRAFDAWLSAAEALCRDAKAEGDMQQQWRPKDVAKTLTASFNGLQMSSLIYSDYTDVLGRFHTYWKIVTPSLFTPAALSHLNLVPPRRRPATAQAD